MNNNNNNNNNNNQQQQKKIIHRRTIDYGNSYGRYYLLKQLGRLTPRYLSPGTIRPEASYLIDLLPPKAYRQNPANDIICKFVHLSANKAKHTVHALAWTPEGRRVLVGAHSGEFTLWNSMTFNFETIMQAHDSSINTLRYSHNQEWLLSGSHDGSIKIWQINFNCVKILNEAHSNAIRDISFSPNDSKFVSCSDDSSLKVWDFNNGIPETTLNGHHWDVKSCDWHSDLGLVVSGSKDNLVKLWDPRIATTSNGNCISTLHGFKNTVMDTKFSTTGSKRLLASVSRDRSGRIFDLRTMKDVVIMRGIESDLNCMAWHPIHSNLLTVGAYDGSINHFVLAPSFSTSNGGATENGFIVPANRIPYAHDKAVQCIQYHPCGHILVSGGADKSTRFWCRARPNDPQTFEGAAYSGERADYASQFQNQNQGGQNQRNNGRNNQMGGAVDVIRQERNKENNLVNSNNDLNLPPGLNSLSNFASQAAQNEAPRNPWDY